MIPLLMRKRQEDPTKGNAPIPIDQGDGISDEAQQVLIGISTVVLFLVFAFVLRYY